MIMKILRITDLQHTQQTYVREVISIYARSQQLTLEGNYSCQSPTVLTGPDRPKERALYVVTRNLFLLYFVLPKIKRQ